MKRVIFLVMAALLAMLILVPGALAQDVHPGDDDPFLPEQNVAVVSHEELAQIAGQPLPKTGGPGIGSALAVVLPASALLLGLGVLAYGVSRHR